jgi:TPR repeat protein
LALGSLKAQTASSDADWQEVARWYRLAAEGDHPAAMVSLGQLYEGGRGVTLDRSEALALYRKALAAGLSAAASEVRRIEEEMQNPEFAG